MDRSFFVKNSRRRKTLDEVRAANAHLLKKSSSRVFYDRYISSMDIDLARFLLEHKDDIIDDSPSKQPYRRRLVEAVLPNRGPRILSYSSKPNPTLTEFYRQQQAIMADRPTTTTEQAKPTKPPRHISQSAERTLDAPDLVDDFYLNLLDWGSRNVLAIALGDTVYLWDATDKSTSELVTVDDDAAPVTSVSWAPDGRHLAVGLDSSEIQLWDSTSGKLLRTLRGAHQSRVGSLAWNDHILTSGGMDGVVVNHDVRVRSHIVHTYGGHQGEVCGLRWAGSGRQLASGGNDNLVRIWDLSRDQPIHSLDEHLSAVKALAWCPLESNLLATGGGDNDRCIKFWNTNTGQRLKSVDTGSQVCALLWSRSERELLSSHGFADNQLTLWKYPSMTKTAELTGHTSRVLFMTQSPDGCTVASAAADETLRFWNVFERPRASKSAKAANTGFFTRFDHIR